MKFPLVYRLVLCLFFTAFFSGAEASHRPISRERLEKLKQDADYRYEERETFQLWEWLGKLGERIRRYISRWLDWDMPIPEADTFSVVVWVLAFLASGALLYIVFRGNWSRLFSRKKTIRREGEYSVLDENIHALNFSDEIEAALREGNQRKATRLYYLRMLKQLTDAGALEWQVNKTNSDYLHELERADLRMDFAFLCTAFEYIWYGEFQPSESLYQETFSRFRSFSEKIPPVN
jgi:hypothetical protein